jgi:CheY-like chemotaxis protein
MVVDDDEAIRRTIAEVLSEEGYAVKEAANGREALDLLRAGTRPCLLLLDLMMPVLDGWGFRQEQERDPEIASVPVVIVTRPSRSAAARPRACANSAGARTGVTRFPRRQGSTRPRTSYTVVRR